MRQDGATVIAHGQADGTDASVSAADPRSSTKSRPARTTSMTSNSTAASSSSHSSGSASVSASHSTQLAHRSTRRIDSRTPDISVSSEPSVKVDDAGHGLEDSDSDEELLSPKARSTAYASLTAESTTALVNQSSTTADDFDEKASLDEKRRPSPLERRESSATNYSDGGLHDEPPDFQSPRKKSTNSNKSKLSRKERDRERTKRFAKEMAFVTVPSIVLSMTGSVLAGEVLSRMKHWPVFLRVEELFILVPILLNLKGNLEMNLAARFSTSANIGELDLRQTRRSLVLGNMALLQVQALLVSLLAGVIAFALGMLSRHGLADSPAALTGHDISVYGVERGGYFEALLVLTASMTSASLSSAVVGGFMCALVICSRFLRINPDNLATPLAASLGDLLALTILAFVAQMGASLMASFVSTITFVVLLLFIALMFFFTIRNAYVQELVWAGWVPLLIALVMSSGTGLVLQAYVNQFRGFGLIAPVVSGVAGNIGAIFVSRISSALHGAKEEKYFLTAATLFCISTPILVAFLAFIWITGQVKIGIAFTLSFVLLAATIIAISLAIGYFLTFWLWNRDYDPDINALPLLSSAVDLCGQGLLVVAFYFAKLLGGDVMAPPPIDPLLGGNSTVVGAVGAIASGLVDGLSRNSTLS